MKQRKILVTGVDGQVGFELLRSLQGLGEVTAVDRKTMDLLDAGSVSRVIRNVAPDIIVNPAAYTAVDRAETEPALAERINVAAPSVMGEEAARSGALLIHFSTDYVFDGEKRSAYVEDDVTNPQNVYGRTKRDGEQAIAEAGCDHLILRTSWVYGMRGHNFLLTMLRLAQERDELRIVSDQLGAPTWSRSIAALTANIIARGPIGDSAGWWTERSGVYNLTSAGSTSWAGFAEAIFDYAQLQKRPVVIPIESGAYPTPAKRPANSLLSHDKLVRVFGLQPPSWQCALQLCLAR
ncbi:dTDP-4-dehydrorhamnose reductase [Paraburkholderia sp. USG1]|uniref:dTDP-4-dehydrorhamnose reductase n=1 Tax=Paraburkholderia sp. USG1 TaxID=2952268 RepID=UPI00286570CF|nr:dTDP-4-dehydrorhamnose reductase [Paraburkholderia sp. USG1]MDR8401577.1 dTDP-4-dehydrorhamnose reductase [Paraburkholderia sp. USG1]